MDRRSYSRFPIQFPMSFSGEGTGGEGTVTDLSKAGWKATVSSSQPVQIGKYLTLHLSVPHQDHPVKVEVAAVRWVRGQEFGVEFLFLGTDEEAELSRFLTSLGIESNT